MTAARIAVDSRGTATDLDAPVALPASALTAPPRFELLAAEIVNRTPGRPAMRAVVLRDRATGRDYPFVRDTTAVSAARSLRDRRARCDSFYGWRSDSPPPTVTFLDQPVTPIYLEAS